MRCYNIIDFVIKCDTFKGDYMLDHLSAVQCSAALKEMFYFY